MNLQAFLYRHPDPGTIWIQGPDRAEYLQRQTSNDIHLLSPEHALATVLTSPTARILDVFYLIQEQEPEGSILAVSWTGNGAGMTRYFRSRIFFMDKVTVEDVSQQMSQYTLFGPQAETALRQVGVDRLPEGAGDLERVDFEGSSLVVFRHQPQLGLGFFLLLPASQAKALEKALYAGGARACPAETFEVARIEAGLPAAPHELNEDYTPFEVGLHELVSSAKGCYTGQEILSRQVTYDKIVRSLVRLSTSELVSAGASLKTDGKPAGKVTSSVNSPRLGPIALAVVRRPYGEPGSDMEINLGDKIIQAKVVGVSEVEQR